MTGIAGPGSRVVWGRLAIVAAAVVWSTAGLGQRGLQATGATQVAGRALFACLALVALVAVMERRGTWRAFRSMGRLDLLYAALVAVASSTFMLALGHTTVANVVFMQAAAPMMAALLGWMLLGERVGARTGMALAFAVAGVAIMAGDSLAAGWEAIALPLAMTSAFACSIIVVRHGRSASMLPATALSQALVVIAVVPFSDFGSAGDGDWAILAGLGVGQIGLGLALLTVGARLIPPTEVAIITLLEVVLGPLLVLLAYGERPATATAVGGLVVLIAVVVQMTARGAEADRAPGAAGQ